MDKIMKSNLTDEMKILFIKVNSIIFEFLKEKYQDYDNFDDFYNKITEFVNNVDYLVVDDPTCNACFCHNDITKDYCFKFNKDMFKHYSFTTGSLAIYIHEFSHLISKAISQINMQRMEEGMADLFSDVIIKYINDNKLLGDIKIEYKATSYVVAGSVVRNVCLEDNDYIDLLWNYYNIDTNEVTLLKMYEKAYGLEATEFLFKCETLFGNITEMLDKEKKYIEDYLLTLDDETLLSLPTICIRCNKILMDKISDILVERKLNIEEAVEKYPNLPFEFKRDYKSKLSPLKFVVESAKKEEDTNKRMEKVVEATSIFFKALNIDSLSDATKKYGVYDEYTIDILLILSFDYGKCIDVLWMNLFPYLYAYENRYKEISVLDRKSFDKYFTSCGFDKVLSGEAFDFYFDITDNVFNGMKEKSKEECFNDIKKILSGLVYEHVEAVKIKNDFEDNKINEEEFKNQMLSLNNKLSDDYLPLYSLFMSLKFLVLRHTKGKKIDEPLFKEVKKELDEYIKQFNLPFDLCSIPFILVIGNNDKTSIFDTVDILSKNEVHSEYFVKSFREIYSLGALETLGQISVENIINYAHAYEQDCYSNNESLYYQRRNSMCYEEFKSVKSINMNILESIIKYSLENNTLINENLLNNIELLYFIKRVDSSNDINLLMEVLKDKVSDIEIKSTDTFNNIVNKMYIDLTKEEQLLELSNYPYLYARYVSNLLPNNKYDTIESLKNLVKDYSKCDIDIIKKAYNYLIEKDLMKIFNGKINSLNSEQNNINNILELLSYDLTTFASEDFMDAIILKLIDRFNVMFNQALEKGFVFSEVAAKELIAKLRSIQTENKDLNLFIDDYVEKLSNKEYKM